MLGARGATKEQIARDSDDEEGLWRNGVTEWARCVVQQYVTRALDNPSAVLLQVFWLLRSSI